VQGVSKLAALVVWMVALVGLAGGAFAFHSRGSEDLFRLQQSGALTLRTATALSAAQVESVVAEAPEPVSLARRTHPARVRCLPGAVGALRNPWSCAIRYRSGTRAHYRVVVQPDGHYTGMGTGIISGCCVKTPMLE
jgi:hypothetical protein